MPLHVWLPLAHPAAPSHVSALMSGVMTKVAVYGFIRIVFDLLGAPTWWSAVVVLVLGGVTAVLGVLYALMQHDLKRLLAYHTVENIGIIFIGLGLALAFQANGFAAGAALALTAALFHVFNHSLFKSLLFFGAGAVLTATGERDMEHLGGLIHRMPPTAFLFLVGCAAISALPPLNGFVSEWLTFQAILLRPDLPQWGLKIAIPADGALLALSAALAAACFVQGVRHQLPRPPAQHRSGAGARGGSPAPSPPWVCSPRCACWPACCPGLVIDGLAPVVQALTGARMPTQLGVAWLSIVPIAAARSSYNGLLVFLFIAGVRLADGTGDPSLRLARAAPRPGLGLRLPRSAPGDAIHRRQLRPADPPRVRHVRVRRAGDGDDAAARRHVARAHREDVCATRSGTRSTRRSPARSPRSTQALNHLQFLTIRRYLSLVFAALVVLLLALALWQ